MENRLRPEVKEKSVLPDFKFDICDSLVEDKKEIVNFGLNDYLSISNDRTVKEKRYPFSNDFINAHIELFTASYSKAEQLLSKIFNNEVILFPDSSQIYSSILCCCNSQKETFIVDEYAQSKILIAYKILKAEGHHTEILPHNRLDLIEEKLDLSKQNHIWYLANSIYSHGSIIPFDKLRSLLIKHKHFRVLIDDTESLSWIGENGQGLATKSLIDLPNVLITAALCKGFGTEGRILICPNRKLKNKFIGKITPFISTYPLNVNAIEASAKIHLSQEFSFKQAELLNRIQFFKELAKSLNLPLKNHTDYPAFFISVGRPDICHEIHQNMRKNGYYINPIIYPTIPLDSSCLKVIISLYHDKKTIKEMLMSLKYEFENAFKKRGLRIGNIFKSNF